MTAPGGGGADEIREQLAAALRETYLLRDEDAVDPLADALLPTVQALIAKGAAAELRSAADEYETDGEIVSALADQARIQFDLASEAAYAITASDFRHIAGRLRDRADALDGTP